jgi:hypothetical protein
MDTTERAPTLLARTASIAPAAGSTDRLPARVAALSRAATISGDSTANRSA